MPRVLVASLLALALASCGSPDVTPESTNGPAATAAVASASTGPSAEPTPTPLAVGTAETDWGPIWLGTPAGFPVPGVGAQPVEPEAGPASGAWTVPVSSRVTSARQVAQFYAGQFTELGLGGTVDGPLEDGSYVSYTVTGGRCGIQVTTLPRGEESLVTVLYGIACPFRWPPI